MSGRVLRTTLAAALMLPLVGSCQRIVPLILVNESNSAIELRYSFEQQVPGPPQPCRLPVAPRQLQEVVSRRGQLDGDWRDVRGYDFDAATCTVTFQVPARTSTIIDMNGACDDYEDVLRRHPQYTPNLKSLRIAAPDSTLELRGWGVAKKFERSSRVCVFRWS
jgi:hypothetical protein